MTYRFDLEQQILACWAITDDIPQMEAQGNMYGLEVEDIANELQISIGKVVSVLNSFGVSA